MIDEVERNVLDNLLEGCQVIGFDWTYLYVNDAVTAQGGQSRQQLLGRTMMDCYPGIENTAMFAELRRCMSERAHHHMENEFTFPDGSQGWFELRFVPVSVGTCILSADVTEKKRAEAALRDSERMFRDLYAAVPDAVLLVSADGSILLTNTEAKRMFGYAADELVGRPIEALVPASLWSAHVHHRQDYVAQPRSRRMGEGFERHGQRKDGTNFSVDVSIGPCTYQGRPAVLGIVRDMTDRDKLEERVRQTQKLEALGSLAGGVAHDFNNILSVILSYSSMLLQDSKAADPIRADVEEIHAAGLRATTLTSQLLAFGRKQILQPQPSDLNDILAGIETLLRRLLREDVELTILNASRLGVANVDPSQVEQIVMNLVVNARDAMPHGGKLTIETANVELDADYAAQHVGVTAGPYVKLAVSDTGVGMDKPTQARMFEPFFTTKEKGTGTGLGLATVFGIVKQSGGHIWVYSEPGKGTTFKVYFPQSDGIVVGGTSTINPPPSPRHGTETILLAEDDERVRVLVRTILRRHGYHVLEAQNGGEALLICEQHGAAIHLLLTDVVMPRMSGRQLADRLKTIRPELKVLYMSGYTDNSIIHHGVLDSNVAFLQKPITPEALIRKLREVLSR